MAAGFFGNVGNFGGSEAMDLGTFQPFGTDTTTSDHNDDDAAAARQSTAIWRLPPEESFSDWTIEIRWLVEAEAEAEADQDNNGTSTTTHPQKEIAGGGGGEGTGGDQTGQTGRSCHYHVHKERLGKGPRSSLYFAKVFRSQFFSECAPL